MFDLCALAVAATVATASPEIHGFAAHLREAIAVNRERREYYESRTRGASKEVSNRLIAQEKLALLAARAFDQRAKPFEDRGIPVVSGAFVSMRLAPDASKSCEGARIADEGTLAEARAVVARLASDVQAAMKLDDFSRAVDASRAALESIEALEKRASAHFAMCRHVIDSLGYCALVAIDSAKRSGGTTTALSRDLVAIQTLALKSAVDTDRLAQAYQAQGVGILVNDLPPIPFLAKLHALKAMDASGSAVAPF
jgi:hypothetical protein